MLDYSSRIARITRLASVLLTSAWPAQAALVFVQAPDGPPLTNPTFAQVAGAGFEAVADLVGGRFGASGEFFGVPPTTWTVRSGTLDPVRFTNTGATAISGIVSARVTGSYSLTRGSGPNDVIATQVFNILSGGIDFTTTEFFAEAIHTLVMNVNQSVSQSIPVVSGGETVAFGQADFFGLDALLSFAFTLRGSDSAFLFRSTPQSFLVMVDTRLLTSAVPRNCRWSFRSALRCPMTPVKR